MPASPLSRQRRRQLSQRAATVLGVLQSHFAPRSRAETAKQFGLTVAQVRHIEQSAAIKLVKLGLQLLPLWKETSYAVPIQQTPALAPAIHRPPAPAKPKSRPRRPAKSSLR